MLGWDIYVYRLAGGGSSPATESTPHGRIVAEWSADVYGLDWLDEMVKAGTALAFGDTPGYPYGYTARARDLVPHLVRDPPEVKVHVRQYVDEGEPAGPPHGGWLEARAYVDQASLVDCRPDEWLGVEAWDQS